MLSWPPRSALRICLVSWTSSRPSNVAAMKLDYNLCVLRLSLLLENRIGRALGCEGLHSPLVFAVRGITASSGFATTELQVPVCTATLLIGEAARANCSVRGRPHCCGVWRGV